ncbi:hypothetical protein M501DRAFT_697450 [Patellaria atrata CBS 101060]|uniref:C3H1-type domain-containing protein n=1 Tax=Patellaria atrata CBS 101060 TaxID=1346257 RepID=A0A9P4SEX0_9PEZI|nr:hypothetical protein M501DRAFT_697450 [Patellaria atrata CBS 101060]
MRKTGAALFANMFKPKQIRRPRVNPNVRHDEKARKFTTLSERWRYETYGRTEPAPNLDDLIYPDKPKTSGSILKKGIAITDSPSTRPTTPEGQNTDELKGTTSLGQFNPSEALSRQFSTHNSTPTPPNEEPSPIESMNSDPISRSSKIPFTCYFWYYGKCKDPKCRYLHNENSSSMGSQSKAELSIPKYLPRPLTCYFWYFTGVCNRSAAACTYAHWNTGFVGNLDKAKGPIEVSTELSRAPNTLEEVTKGSGAPQIGNYNLMHNFSPKNSVTCFFWKFGYCSNFRANRPCAYAHQDCYLVANPPGIFQPRTDPDKLLLERQKVATGKPFLNPDFGVRGSCLSDEALDWPAPHLSVNNSAVHSRSRILSPPAQSREHDIMIDFEEVGIGVILTINTGNGTTDLPIMLMNNSPDARERLVIEIGASGKLIIDSICLTDDFESYGYDDDETSTFGYILPTKESRRIFQTYAESLMTHNTAAVVFHKSFTMIIYPAHVEKRKYLDSVCDFPEQALLRYYVRSPIQSHRINRQTIELDTSTNGETIIQRIFDINPEKIFKGTTPQPLEKNVFLMIPSFQEVELDLLTRVFLSMDAVVYRLQAPGSWTQFGKKTRSGVIIIHPDITEYSAIPQLDFRFLGRQYEFFRLGYDPHAENLQVQPNYKLISLFPNGRVICITDDVFVDYRSEALRIVKYFVKEDALKAQGFKNRKFAGRPGLLPWMFDRIFEEPQDPIIAETYQELEKLAPPQLQVKSSPLNPGPLASLVSERVEFWPAYPEMWKKDRTKATECLVEWFAGWACCEVTNFRRFIVVHTVDKPNWRKQYQHLHFFSLSGFLEAHGIK